MASPTAHSPPHTSHIQLANINTMTSNKKRASEGAAPPALKRRAISTPSGPGSAHPLRQTSFPPDDAGTPYGPMSPSSIADVDAMSTVSGSLVNAAAPVKKKRGRKSKAEKAREQTPSVVGGRAPTAISGVSEGGGRGTKSVSGAAGGAGDEDGEGDDEGPTEVAATADIQTKEQKEEEHRKRQMLISALSEEQFDRYENWRAGNLSKASVRRLINATTSQSVPENVVITMRAVSKVFIGDIIEGARRVQGEWIKNGEKQTDLPADQMPGQTLAQSSSQAQSAAQTESPAQATPDSASKADTQEQPPPPQQHRQETDDRRGPLRPDHLREAIRRYRVSGEGGGVGMQRIFHQQQQGGAERFPMRTGGYRIFR
ncbi:hTAFII28-like protein conserved region-domain-containing protein [Chaetomium strumarium]|uniref:HTAFII28-like protein conserved region-domain-containing protein n=1 Tax=Chaetomium strumarium TaxID=1170767 RepID=A0AAJ0GZW1_9PEZI|nr:hTAFII28-like protein conserved region-domain-containing protein [Chaetomium strumarium]